MWISKGVALIRGGHLFEAQHLLEKIKYANQKKRNSGHIIHSNSCLEYLAVAKTLTISISMHHCIAISGISVT